MIPRRQRLAAALVEAAPLAGLLLAIALWILRDRLQLDPLDDWTMPLAFVVPGALMLAAGAIAAGLALAFGRSPFVRTRASTSLRFHAIAFGACLLLAAVLFVWSLLDTPPFSIFHQPTHFEGAVMTGIVAYGFLLPLILVLRALVESIGAMRASNA